MYTDAEAAPPLHKGGVVMSSALAGWLVSRVTCDPVGPERVAVEMGGDDATELGVVDDAGELDAVDAEEGIEEGIAVVADVVGFLALPEHAPSKNKAVTAEQSTPPARPDDFTRYPEHVGPVAGPGRSTWAERDQIQYRSQPVVRTFRIWPRRGCRSMAG
ncbi:MAG: hypothetical protein M3256_07165 [Actinomycetota bacterium]|nr:hypothetical protein [Actinomycetota bacterium]